MTEHEVQKRYGDFAEQKLEEQRMSPEARAEKICSVHYHDVLHAQIASAIREAQREQMERDAEIAEKFGDSAFPLSGEERAADLIASDIRRSFES